MNYQFEQLVNLEQVRKLLDSHNGFSGMAYGLFDTNENNLLAVGWQDICTQFHRVHPVSCARCRESDAYLKTDLYGKKGPCLEYCCKNGMIDVAMPIMVEGRHLATFFTGQFFYEGEQPDRAFFIRQADELGFEQEGYLAALDRVPVFSREHVRTNMLFLHNMVEVLAEVGLANMKQVREAEERKRVEADLAVREREFRTLAENTPDPIYRYNRDCRRVYVNPAVEKISGISASELLGKTPAEAMIVSSAESTRAQESIMRVLEAGQPEEVEVTMIAPDGSKHYFQNVHIPEFGPDGTVETVLSIGRNITERKQLEAELLRRTKLQEQLAAVAEAVPGFIYTARFEANGHNATFPYASPGIVELLGVRPEEIRDNADALRACYHPDDIPGLFRRIAETRQTGAPFRYELRAMHPDKGLRWIEMRSTVQLLPDGAAVAHGVMIDSTERKNAEIRLQEMQSRLTTIFATIPDLVWLKDANGVYLACNMAFEEFSGAAESDLIGKTDYDIMDVEQADCCRKTDYDAILAGDVCFSEEEVVYGSDGRHGLLEIRKVPVYGAGGCLAGILGIGRDITERKQTEDALKQQNIFQNSLFTGLQNADVNLLLAEGGRFTYCNNSRFGEPFGLSEADMAAKPEFIRFVHPDDRARVAEIYQRRSAGEQMPTSFEVGVQWANGERREVELVVSVMGYNPLKTLIIYKDITERKRMEQVLFAREQEFHTLVENAPDPIFRYDRNCRRTYVNPAAQRLLETPVSELLGRAPLETLLHWPVKFYQEMLQKVLESGEESEFELTLKRLDSEQNSYMHVRVVPEYNTNGGVNGVLAIGRDITERKLMEDELQRKNSELERFTYTVSHDLKSPVITIRSFSGSIKHDLRNGRHDRVEKDLDRICTAADKMTLLLDDLLKLSRSGKVIDAPVPVNMTQLVKEVLKSLDGALQESGAQVIVQPNLPIVLCDRQRMAEVLQNLIENAVKYRAAQPEPRIEIGLRQDGDQQVFFVQDNGPGIDPRYHDNVFGLFNRLDTSTSGTGVGLALVKRIVETHGGKVWVESDGLGNGSTFCFTVGN